MISGTYERVEKKFTHKKRVILGPVSSLKPLQNSSKNSIILQF